MSKAVEKALRRLRVALRERGMRLTQAREKVLEEIFESGGHLDAEELVAKLKRRGVSRATVYRTLRLLEELGLVRRVIYGERHSHFERVIAREHHDHLICVRCGRIVEFENPRIERLQEEVAKEHGFEIVGHTLEIRGVCPACRSKAPSKGRP
ncbi:MAG TPA: transcriptional repressor [Armatimonadetes bacterium]|nr:transcriptional repressor [Armatimonadota bacterium]